MGIDGRLPHRARMLMFTTLELLRNEIRPRFATQKEADDWLFGQLDLTKGELAQVYKGRGTLYYDDAAVDLEAAEQRGKERLWAEENVKLEPGMVGVLKHSDELCEEIRGKRFQIARVDPFPGYAECSVEGFETTFNVHAVNMAEVGMPVPSLGDLFSTKEVDGHVLAGLDKDALIKALKDATVGTVITGVRDASGRYDFDTHIEKHGGYVRNHFAPVRTADYDTWWEVGGSKRHEYDLVDILQGKSKYYALAEKEDGTSMNEKDTGVRDLAGRLVGFYKDFDFYEFIDSLGPGGEEESVSEIEKMLGCGGGSDSFVQSLKDIISECELDETEMATVMGLIKDLTDLEKSREASSLDSQIQDAKGKENKPAKISAPNKDDVELDL